MEQKEKDLLSELKQSLQDFTGTKEATQKAFDTIEKLQKDIPAIEQIYEKRKELVDHIIGPTNDAIKQLVNVNKDSLRSSYWFGTVGLIISLLGSITTISYFVKVYAMPFFSGNENKLISEVLDYKEELSQLQLFRKSIIEDIKSKNAQFAFQRANSQFRVIRENSKNNGMKTNEAIKAGLLVKFLEAASSNNKNTFNAFISTANRFNEKYGQDNEINYLKAQIFDQSNETDSAIKYYELALKDTLNSQSINIRNPSVVSIVNDATTRCTALKATLELEKMRILILKANTLPALDPSNSICSILRDIGYRGLQTERDSRPCSKVYVYYKDDSDAQRVESIVDSITTARIFAANVGFEVTPISAGIRDLRMVEYMKNDSFSIVFRVPNAR